MNQGRGDCERLDQFIFQPVAIALPMQQQEGRKVLVGVDSGSDEVLQILGQRVG